MTRIPAERRSTSEDQRRVSDLILAWRRLEHPDQRVGAKAYVDLGFRVLAAGEPLLGYDVVSAGIARWPEHVRLRQLAALALARAGATERAAALLKTLHEQGNLDGDTLGILARTYKDLWEHARSPSIRARLLQRSERIYGMAYRLARRRHATDDAIYTGVNAATLATLSGSTTRGRRLAREVATLCRRRLARGGDYWAKASLAEAILLTGDFAAAERIYRDAVAAGRGQYANILSTRRHARLILRHLGHAEHDLDGVFEFPGIAAFSGHMIDRPRRSRARFREADAPAIGRRLAAWVSANRIEVGYSGAASGSDILFIEALLARGAEANVVLPCAPERFVQESVKGDEWRARFARIIDGPARVTVLARDLPADATMLYEYANRVVAGLATLRARLVETQVRPLVVWDGQKSGRYGGTDSFVELWRRRSIAPEVIPPRDSHGPARRTATHGTASSASTGRGRNREAIVAILFADIVGYTHMPDVAARSLVHELMTWLARRSRRPDDAPLASNTWGDAIHLVFPTVQSAGRWALDLAEHARTIVRPRSDEPLLRIGVHAGPARAQYNPVTRRRDYVGFQVNWAARIEPITVPGEVYASQQFAALAALEDCSFACEYVGVVPLAKETGSFPLFRVRRTAAPRRQTKARVRDRRRPSGARSPHGRHGSGDRLPVGACRAPRRADS